MVRKCHQSKDFDMEHIPGIINPSGIFTKEIKDNTPFRNIIDSIMVSLQASLNYSHNVPSHIISAKKNPSLLFHTFRTHSSRHFWTQINYSRRNSSKHSVTPIGIQIDRVKGSSPHSLDRGVLTVVKSMNTDPSVCLLSAPNNRRRLKPSSLL